MEKQELEKKIAELGQQFMTLSLQRQAIEDKLKTVCKSFVDAQQAYFTKFSKDNSDEKASL